MAGCRQRYGDGSAQDEASIRGHIGDVQDSEAQEQGHGNQRVQESQFQSSL